MDVPQARGTSCKTHVFMVIIERGRTTVENFSWKEFLTEALEEEDYTEEEIEEWERNLKANKFTIIHLIKKILSHEDLVACGITTRAIQNAILRYDANQFVPSYQTSTIL